MSIQVYCPSITALNVYSSVGQLKFAGLQNFSNMINDPIVVTAVVNGLRIYSGVSGPGTIGFVLAFYSAEFVDRRFLYYSTFACHHLRGGISLDVAFHPKFSVGTAKFLPKIDWIDSR
jgi:hypothetical protein